MNITEIQTTGAYELSGDGETAERMFLCHYTGLEVSLVDCVEQNAIPEIGDRHPNGNNMYAIKLSSNYKTDQGGTAAIVTVSYSSRGTSESEDENFVSFCTRGTSVFVDHWRSNPDPPVDPNLPGLQLVTGEPIDIGGQPVSLPVAQVTFDTSFITQGVPLLASLVDAIGTRNSTSFLGFNTGYLLYIGPAIDRVGVNTYQRRDSFLYDQYMHCRQAIMQCDLDGRPQIETQAGDAVSFGKAKYVQWVQPFPRLSNFGNLGIPL